MRASNLSLPPALPPLVGILLLLLLWFLLLVLLLWFSLPRRRDEVSAPEAREGDRGETTQTRTGRSGRGVGVYQDDLAATPEVPLSSRPRVREVLPAAESPQDKTKPATREADDSKDAFDEYTRPGHRRDDFDF